MVLQFITSEWHAQCHQCKHENTVIPKYHKVLRIIHGHATLHSDVKIHCCLTVADFYSLLCCVY